MRFFITVFLVVLAVSFCDPIRAYAGPEMPAAISTPVVPTASVVVAEPAAPPAWAQDLIVTAESLPVVGPILSKALLYLGILSSILTVMVGALITVLNTLMGALNLAGLVRIASALAAFRDGRVMYWLKFFSLFNARKKQ